MDILEQLLGQTKDPRTPGIYDGPGGYDPSKDLPQGQGQVEQDIEVQRGALDQPKTAGLFQKGPFALGNKGANILGQIGDAFLIAGGADPIYAPNHQRKREADALEDYRTNPDEAFDKYVMVNPNKAVELRDRSVQNDYLNQQRQAAAQLARQKYSDGVNERGTRILGAATKETWPAIRAQVMRYFESKGVEPYFQIPESFDAAQVEGLRLSGVPTKDQYDDEGMSEYRNDQIGVRRESNAVRREVGLGGIAQRREAAREAGVDRRRDVDSKIKTRENPPARPGIKTGPAVPKPVYDPKTGKFTLKR